MNGKGLTETAARTVIALALALAAGLALKYALPIALPFLIALGLGLAISPLASSLHRRTRLPAGLCSLLLIALFLALALLILGFAVTRLLAELLRFASGLGDAATGLGSLVEYFSELSSNLPFLRELREKSNSEEFWQAIDSAVSGSLSGAVERALSSVCDGLISLAGALPTAALTVTVTLLATYYFSQQKSRDELMALLPSGAAERLRGLGKRIGAALRAWARAYLLILLITALELFIGFSILGVDYALLAALGVALVDILPILGTGTVLIPWSIIGFAGGDRRLGLGLLILYAVISLVRQLTEPKLVGKSLGLPPIISLIGFYVGYRLFGFFGMIAAPAVLMIALPKRKEN